MYSVYVVTVLRSVQSTVFISHLYLKKRKKWLEDGSALEHVDSIKKKPWYFLDQNEKIAYQTLYAKYLYEQGNFTASYRVFEEIDEKMLYPEELSNLIHSKVVLLIDLGNLSKADELLHNLEKPNPPSYYALKSYLEELRGDLTAAFQNARKGEDAIPKGYKDYNALSSLYTQLGRYYFFRNNITEVFRYYRAALDAAKKNGDIRLCHTAYQNLIGQMQINHKAESEIDSLMSEYISMMGQSLKNQLEVENFQIGIARASNDRIAEFEAIKSGYKRLHDMTTPPESYMVEVSALKMLCNGRFPIDFLLNEVKSHFDSYFQLPMPARARVVQDFSLPLPMEWTPELQPLFNGWTDKLVQYANKQALKDLDEYDKTLSSDDINERCWVISQKIDFTRRSQPNYDGKKVLQWMRELIQNYADSGQLARQIEAEVNLINEYDELIGLQQISADDSTLDTMRKILNEAYMQSKFVPPNMVAASLIEIAHFSAKLGNFQQAQSAIQDFSISTVSPSQLSAKHQIHFYSVSNFLSHRA